MTFCIYFWLGTSFDYTLSIATIQQTMYQMQLQQYNQFLKQINFIEPTIIVTTDPKFKTMVEEVFGPVMTIYVYDADKWEETLELVDNTSEYALTGAVLSVDRYAAEYATKALENAAGNFYINDKPTGAVVGQQPFGGARGSGTNDKAGSILNLLRWVSPRTIKETFVPATDYKYPFLG